MGCGPSKVDPALKDASLQHDRIEKQIRQDKKNDSRTVKILLLGQFVSRDKTAAF